MRTLARATLIILAALAVASASAQKDFDDVTTNLFSALEAIERPCAMYGWRPDDAAYSRCGIILDTLTNINKTIIEQHFANAGYSMFTPWEVDQTAHGTLHGTGFGRPQRGALTYIAFYIEIPATNASGVWILADWP